jgi:hypothetical protein
MTLGIRTERKPHIKRIHLPLTGWVWAVYPYYSENIDKKSRALYISRSFDNIIKIIRNTKGQP